MNRSARSLVLLQMRLVYTLSSPHSQPLHHPRPEATRTHATKPSSVPTTITTHRPRSPHGLDSNPHVTLCSKLRCFPKLSLFLHVLGKTFIPTDDTDFLAALSNGGRFSSMLFAPLSTKIGVDVTLTALHNTRF